MSFDVVIAGAGLAGLSLAVQLADDNLRVLIVDDPTAPRVERWGFWSRDAGPLDAAISARFSTITLYAQRSKRILPLAPYTYNVVHRADLEKVARSRLADQPGFVMAEGHVHALHDAGDHAEVVVDDRVQRASWAFDARGGRGPGEPDAHLAFVGWEVACTRPSFDPSAVTLFDFRTPRPGTFAYVVPDCSRRALVEVVAFAPRHHVHPSIEEMSTVLKSYLDDFDYTIERRESAVVPLCTRLPGRIHGRVVALGARGGLIKASTGYAFGRILDDSAAIAESLRRTGSPYGVRQSRRRHRTLDAIPLRALDRDPRLLEVVFDRLFARNPAERVLRFLDERAGFGDELRLIASLPVRPFLGALALRPSGSSQRRGPIEHARFRHS